MEAKAGKYKRKLFVILLQEEERFVRLVFDGGLGLFKFQLVQSRSLRIVTSLVIFSL